jgi:hypothetical protein
VLRDTPRRPPEFEFLKAAAATVGVVAAVTLPLSVLFAGLPGLVGAGAGLGLIAALFGLSAVLHIAAAPFGAQVWMGLTVGGFAFRMLGYFGVMRALEGVDGVSTLALGLTAAAGILIGQFFELRALTRARSGAYVGRGLRPSENLKGDDR